MIHIVYPFGPRKAAPWSIGNHLARALGPNVSQYDWDVSHVIAASIDDILIGHPHDNAGYVFENSLSSGWKKKIAIFPWNGSHEYTQRIEKSLSCDHIFLISGPYWRDKLPLKYRNKCSFLDIAIDKDDYPRQKEKFNEPGLRHFLNIGCTLPCKNPMRLSRLAYDRNFFHHVGYGQLSNWFNYGYISLEKNQGFNANKYDFLLVASSNDANPTVVLEALSWGLIPICSPTAGWTEGILNLPDDDKEAIDFLKYLQIVPSEKLLLLHRRLVTLLDKCTWGNFTKPIIDFILR